MKIYGNLFTVAALVVFMVPQVALAAWWNPISWDVWNIFRLAPKTQQVQVAASTSTASTSTTTKKIETNARQASDQTRTEGARKQKTETPISETANMPRPTPVSTQTKPAEIQEQAPKISNDLLGSELLKFLNAQLAEQIRSDLDYYSKTVSDIRDLINLQKDIAQRGTQNCLASYNSKVSYARDYAQQQTTANAESQRGFASMPAISQNISAQLARDLESIEIWKSDCLAKYQVNSSLESRLSQISNNLSSLRERFNGSSVSVSSSEISSIRNDLLSISRSLASQLGVSGSLSLPSVRVQSSSVTCTNDVSGFSCRDNFGSNVMRCSQSAPGFLNCSDSNYKSVSCQSGAIPGSVKCSW